MSNRPTSELDRRPDAQTSDYPHLIPAYRFNWLALLVIAFGIVTVIGLFMAEGLVVAIGVMGLVAAAISMGWNRIALEELSYDMEVAHQRVEVGDTVPITVSLVNKKPVPLAWVKVEDEFPNAVKVMGGDIVQNSNTKIQSLRHLTSMGWYERIRWEYEVKCTKRGHYRMGPATLESGDPFGFVRTQKRQHHYSNILVLPKVVPLIDLGLPAVRPLGEVRGGDRIYEDVTRPAGLRDYQKGDALTRIDWKATARNQKLLVRTFDPSSTVNVIIAVAVDTTEPFWRLDAPDELERVITVAASVADHVAELDYTFGVFANDMAVKVRRSMKVPPSQGRDQLGEVMSALATTPPMASGPMSRHLAEHGPRFPFGTTIVLCTALIDDEMVATLDDLDRGGAKIVVMYVGKAEPPEMPPRVKIHSLRKHIDTMKAAGTFGGAR